MEAQRPQPSRPHCGAVASTKRRAIDRRREFYVGQLWDWKRSAEIELMAPSGLAAYAEMCGWALARAHARSGDRVAIGAYLGAGDRFYPVITRFATSYADQTERDHEALLRAVNGGQVEADRDR